MKWTKKQIDFINENIDEMSFADMAKSLKMPYNIFRYNLQKAQDAGSIKTKSKKKDSVADIFAEAVSALEEEEKQEKILESKLGKRAVESLKDFKKKKPEVVAKQEEVAAEEFSPIGAPATTVPIEVVAAQDQLVGLESYRWS